MADHMDRPRWGLEDTKWCVANRPDPQLRCWGDWTENENRAHGNGCDYEGQWGDVWAISRQNRDIFDPLVGRRGAGHHACVNHKKQLVA